MAKLDYGKLARIAAACQERAKRDLRAAAWGAATDRAWLRWDRWDTARARLGWRARCGRGWRRKVSAVLRAANEAAREIRDGEA